MYSGVTTSILLEVGSSNLDESAGIKFRYVEMKATK